MLLKRIQTKSAEALFHVRRHKKAIVKRTADCALSILPPPTANLSSGLSISVLGKCFLILKFAKHVGKMWNHPQINRNQTNRVTFCLHLCERWYGAQTPLFSQMLWLLRAHSFELGEMNNRLMLLY